MDDSDDEDIKKITSFQMFQFSQNEAQVINEKENQPDVQNINANEISFNPAKSPVIKDKTFNGAKSNHDGYNINLTPEILLELACDHYDERLKRKVYISLVAHKRFKKAMFAKNIVADSFYAKSTFKKCYCALNKHRLFEKQLRMKSLEAIAHCDSTYRAKAWRAFKRILEQNEDIEIAYGEAALIHESNLMKKVMKAIKIVNV